MLRSERPLAPAVAEALEAQNARLPPCPRRAAALEALRAGAAAVVTGQQVGLFLGPLYTLHKTVSAIRNARALAEASGRPVVPVFWLQTEDHDLPEVAGCAIPSCTVRVTASPEDRVSIAHRVLPDEVTRCLDELRAELHGGEHARVHLERLARHYRPGARWSDAFAGVLAELFAGEGLVFIDPRDPALAGAARPVHERALLQAEAISAAMPAAPIHVRPGAPLSFFHPDGALGPRVRLEPCGDGRFREVGGDRTWDRRQLLQILEEEPLRFSTSALLRPILQDTLLPTAAYVGGPAEVAYFTQLPTVYAAYGLPMPRVAGRARFRLVPAGVRKLLDRLGLEPPDSERSEEELLTRCRRGAGPSGDELTRPLLEAFDAAGAGLATAVAEIAPHLPREAARARTAVGRSLARLSRKIDRAVLLRDRDLVDMVRRLKATLHPGAPQERCLGLAYFAAHASDRAIVERLLLAAAPFDATLKDVEL